MKVTLIDSTAGDHQVELLNFIASQSRSHTPINIEGLFERTLDWGHKSIQEFATYIFHVEDVSRSLLAQITRHRHATFNVMSGRHVQTSKVVLPKGITRMNGVIELEDGGSVNWRVDNEGDLSAIYSDGISPLNRTIKDCPIPLESIRFGFPIGSCISFFMRINGSSLRNFLTLRLDRHAQWEIRELACRVYDLVKAVNPIMIKGLETLRYNADK